MADKMKCEIDRRRVDGEKFEAPEGPRNRESP